MAFNPFPTEDSSEPHRRLLTPNRSPLGSRENSPAPDRLAALQYDSPKRGPSPCLPRKTLEELETGEVKRKGGSVDPDDPPLRTPWTFWFERAPSGGPSNDYSQALKNIYTVRTIKQFFSVYNNLKSPSLLKPKECYHLMRCSEEDSPRKPLWEDPDNLNGGICVFKCRKDMTANVWLELLLAAIGEQFIDSTAEGDDVVGVSIKIREYETDTLQIWNDDATRFDSAKVMDRVCSIMPFVEVRDCFYSSIKDKLSGHRTHTTSSSQYRESPPPQAFSSHPRHQFNPFSMSYRQPAPPRGGGYKKGTEGYYRYPSPRPFQSGGQRFTSSHFTNQPAASTPSQFS